MFFTFLSNVILLSTSYILRIFDAWDTLYINEVQEVPETLSYIQEIVDETGKKGVFIPAYPVVT